MPKASRDMYGRTETEAKREDKIWCIALAVMLPGSVGIALLIEASLR